MQKSLKISVITVVYNDSEHIEKTIQSVLNQGYNGFEYIIIDGGSTDGTTEIISKYIDSVSFYCSEPDNGIYDAMNKGLRNAKGEWLIFMNSGDQFYSNDVLQLSIQKMTDTMSNYYGNCVFYNAKTTYTFIAQLYKKSNFLKHNTFSHQSIFYSNAAIKTIGEYDLRYTISSDFNFTFKLFSISRFENLSCIVAKCSLDGISFKHALTSYKDRMHTFFEQKEYLFYTILLIKLPFFKLKNFILQKISNSKILALYRRIKYRKTEA